MHAIRFSLVIFSLIFTIALTDIVYDWEEAGAIDSHVMVEMFMAMASLVAFVVLMRCMWLDKKALKESAQRLSSAKRALSAAEHQTQKLMGDFSKIIQAQFTDWQFTQSEKEVALLLLKGLSLEEIAVVRETKEKTVRQQASNLYKKAGVCGRHELVAFFFEDLLID